jgi:hypothetical protein
MDFSDNSPVKVREDLPGLFNRLEFTVHGAEVGVQAGVFSAILRQGWDQQLILTLSKGNLDALLSLGKWLLMTGDPKGALPAFREALLSDPTNKAALSGLQKAQSLLPAGQA